MSASHARMPLHLKPRASSRVIKFCRRENWGHAPEASLLRPRGTGWVRAIKNSVQLEPWYEMGVCANLSSEPCRYLQPFSAENRYHGLDPGCEKASGPGRLVPESAYAWVLPVEGVQLTTIRSDCVGEAAIGLRAHTTMLVCYGLTCQEHIAWAFAPHL
jgi:hypothetical protein